MTVLGQIIFSRILNTIQFNLEQTLHLHKISTVLVRASAVHYLQKQKTFSTKSHK